MPLPYRWLTALMTRYNGSSLLIDCGEGTQIAIKEKGWSFKPIDVICFTHYHGDHISGLPGLLLTMGNAERTEPLTLVGPRGLERVVTALRVIAPELPFPIEFRELTKPQEEFALNGYRIRAFRVNHNVTCYGYAIEIDRAGKFQLEQALKLEIPKPFWNRLQKGETVEEGGVVYTPETLAELAKVLTRKSREIGHPIYLISDEPYRELAYDGADVPYLPGIYPNTVICYSYSKILSLPGERIGYVCVPDAAEDSASLYAAIAGAARTLGHVCAPSLQQKVVAQCVDIRPNLAAYDRNRTTLYDALTAYGYQCVKPQGAFYLFPKAPGGNALAFSERAKSENLLLVPGDDFGCPDFFRISTCVSYDMVCRSLPVFQKLIASR